MHYKFTDIEIIPFLQNIVDDHVVSYKDDFDYDKKVIQNAAKNSFLLWMCRTLGTWRLNEKEVFMRNSFANDVWNNYCDDIFSKNREILAFAVKITRKEGEKVYGNVYELDYKKQLERVQASAVKADNMIVHFENGVFTTSASRPQINVPESFGKIINYEPIPNDKEALKEVLMKEHISYERLHAGDENYYTPIGGAVA